ncbi:protein of unknown function [Hyphomicrobium sp. 1Nfss2.1]
MSEKLAVRLDGKALWWLRNEDGSGPLAPLHHCDATGELEFEAIFEDSYAHVMRDGSILRYHRQIGTRDDLEIVAANPPAPEAPSS